MLVVVAAVVLAAALVVFGLELGATQGQARATLTSRFRDRAQTVAALMQAEISAVASSSATTPAYATATPTDRALDQAVAQSHLVYALVLTDRGQVLAASHSLTPGDRARVLAEPAVHRVLAGASVFMSDVVAAGPQGAPVVDLAVNMPTPAGPRVVIGALPTPALGAFLNTYLTRLASAQTTSFMLDSRGDVVGASDPTLVTDRRLSDGRLLSALAHSSGGPYGDGDYFTTAAVPDTSWRVVLTSTSAALFRSVNGSRQWLPWVIYAAFGLLALGCIGLLYRLVRQAAALHAANARLAAGNARLESTNALLRRAAELSRSNAELEQFASIASHDLQEPLRKVQTFAAQVMTTEYDRLSDQGQDFLRRMSDAAGRMRTLIDDLLTFSRVTTQGRPFTLVDLGDVARQVLVDLEVAIADTDARVAIGPTPAIEADPLQMRQLLQNLIGNALKFRRPDATPEVTVEGHIADDVAEISVTDNGIGFDPQYATRIFRAFERLHGARTYPGTGIGLALCRKIVERHHGTITAESEPGHGATFTIRLPVQQPAESADDDAQLFPEIFHHDEVSPHVHV